MQGTLSGLALEYLGRCLAVLPANVALKCPGVSWKPYQTGLPKPEDVIRWFSGHVDALCVVAGTGSGHLEVIDFDFAGAVFPAWRDAITQNHPGLLDRLVIEKTPSGGFHVIYRSQEPVSGNMKLAQRKIMTDGPDEVVLAGKKYKPRKDRNGQYYVIVTLIETRGEGGIFLCAPSPGYEFIQNDFSSIPVLTSSEREVLLEAAWQLNDLAPEPFAIPIKGASAKRPGDDYNATGDVRAVLEKHGWKLIKPGENEYWRRPGKDSGWSATLKDNVFYVFSSSADPFEPEKAYSPFAVYAMLEHAGNFAAAAKELKAMGFGEETPDVDISGILPTPAPPTEPDVADPGPLPEDLFRIPGFVSEVMDHCIETAPYPNVAMAFAGALSLMAFLAGRKVRDPGDNRSNIYLLGLAHSASGKDWPRKINVKILHQIGLSACLGERFASGEGIQDALFGRPNLLFQTDEIDGILQQINKSLDARHENIMGTLLTLFSASNSVFPMRKKAGKDNPGDIVQPNLTIFGTAIPNHYYEAISERMLTNGFLARMIVLESGARPKGQEPRIIDLPTRILETAKWWADFNPGSGNLEKWNPVPVVIEHTDDAREMLIAMREDAEAEYRKAEVKKDPIGTTIWGRVSEMTRKLALLYAVSETHEGARIGKAAVDWAGRIVMHQTRRMLFMASQHVADNPFHALCLKFIRKLREAPGQEIAHSVLLKRMKVDSRTFQELVKTLMDQNDIELSGGATAGRPQRGYRLISGAKETAKQEGERSREGQNGGEK